jgi:hypothetical protein
MSLTVEFYGVPRMWVGVSLCALSEKDRPRTLGELWPLLAARLPGWRASGLETPSPVQRTFAVNLDGERFVSDPATSLEGVSSVLILSADAGG